MKVRVKEGIDFSFKFFVITGVGIVGLQNQPRRDVSSSVMVILWLSTQIFSLWSRWHDGGIGDNAGD